MSNRYFFKELVNNLVHLADGSGTIPFVHGADDNGFLALDTDKPEDAVLIKEIEACIKRRMGGMCEIDQARYEAEKKKQPFSRLNDGQAKHAPRLHVQSDDPFRKTNPAPTGKPFAQSAMEQKLAAVPVAPNPVPIVAGQGSSNVELPPSPKPAFAPRRGAPRAKK